jgi:hypothetical protein
MLRAQIGDADGAAAALASVTGYLADLRRSEPKDSMAPIIVEALTKTGAAEAAFEQDDLPAARRIAMDVVSQVQPIKPQRGVQEVQKFATLYTAANFAGHADYLLGNFPAAEQEERAALEARKHYLTEAVVDRRDLAEKSTWLAMAIARQGRLGEAAQVIDPVVAFQRELKAKNHGDRWQPTELAAALYAQSLAEPKQRAALLREATMLLDGVPPTLQSLHDIRQWRERIRAAQRGAQAAPG